MGKNSDTKTSAQKSAFLIELIRNYYNISEACKHAGVTNTTYYNWLKKDPDFASQVEHSKLQFIEAIQSQYHKALKDGVENVQQTERIVYNSENKMVSREVTISRKKSMPRPNEYLNYLKVKAPQDFGYQGNQDDQDGSNIEFTEE